MNTDKPGMAAKSNVFNNLSSSMSICYSSIDKIPEKLQRNFRIDLVFRIK